MKKTIITALIIALLIPAISQAKSIRCHGKMLRAGSLKYDVIKHCGEPDERSVIGSSKAKYSDSESEAVREEWFYKDLVRGKDVIFIITGTRVTDATILK